MAVESDLKPQKQYGFFFRADNCIACHSCEAACSEKNGNPPRIAWRHVGYLEGGSFDPRCGSNDFLRLNTSMACNHCTDPVCLKGCPTGAYVKYEKYGAVIQDSDICFGCQYCTWVCPYNAPAYDPVKGSVSKCNMCVDRLDLGLNPACVEACLGHALEFGEMGKRDIEESGWVTRMAGFPDPSITQPNVRFQRHKPIPTAMIRTDSVPLRYVPKSPAETGEPVVPQVADPRVKIEPAGLSLRSLKTGELPLAIFTLLVQMVIGAFWTGFGLLVWMEGQLPPPFGTAMQWFFPGLVAALAVGMGLSTAHLGKPWRCYRALNNLRYSWLSREILAVGSVFGGLLLYAGLLLVSAWLPPGLPGMSPQILQGVGWGVCLIGAAAIYCMGKIYLIPARPYWNHPHTMVAFFTSALNLGPLAVASGLLCLSAVSGVPLPASLMVGVTVALGVAWVTLVVQRVSEWNRARALATRTDEAAASRELLTRVYHRWVNLRLGLTGLQLLLVPVAILIGLSAAPPADLIAGLTLGAFAVAVPKSLVGRIIMYLVVVPTTMPGAFFVRNPGFVSMARKSDLAADPLIGVVPAH